MTPEQELEQLRQLTRRRAMTAYAEWSDGLAYLLAAAEVGDPQALLLLKETASHMDRLLAIQSRIIIPAG